MSKVGIKHPSLNNLVRAHNIFLTGFMGAGKTTVGGILARQLGWQFVDTDEEIEKKTEFRIQDILRDPRKGEAFLRCHESEVIHEFSQRLRQVVALGGGSLLRLENREICKNSGIVFYLHVAAGVLAGRLREGLGSRPLLGSSESDLQDGRLQQLLEDRRPGYEAADFIIEAGSDRAEKSVEQILKILGGCERAGCGVPGK